MAPTQEDRIGVPKDELEFEPVEARPPKKPWGRRLAIMVALIVAGGVGWHFLGSQIGLNQTGDVPLVRAEVAPVKIKPADPGGLEVPDRDKLVYGRLNGEGAGTDVESLLPPPEEPMEVPQPVVQPEPEQQQQQQQITEAMATDDSMETNVETMAEVEATSSTQNMTQSVSVEPQPIEETTAATATSTTSSDASETPPPPPAPVEAVEAQEILAPPPEPESKTTASALEPAAQEPEKTATTATAQVTSTSEQYRIQLAALRTHASAEAEWNRLKKAHPDVLDAYNLFVQRVDKGGSDGVYYRLQAGPFRSKGAAKTVCDQLASRNVACLVKRTDN